MALLLSNEDVSAVLSMDDCMGAMEQAFAELGRGEAVTRSRSDLIVPQPEPGRYFLLKTCDAALPGAGLAAVRITSNMMQEIGSGAERRLDPLPLAIGKSFVGLVMLFDMATLDLVAIIQDARIQVMRAGAAYGIAAKYLARSNAEVIGVLGAGQQAREQLTAIAMVRPLRLVKVFSPTKANRERFAAEMAERLGIDVVAHDEPRSVVAGSDIVASTTTSLEPVFPGTSLEPGQHVSSARATELDDVARERASFIVLQSAERTMLLAPPGNTDSPWARARRREPDPARLVVLGDLVVGRHPGRTSPTEITLLGGYETFGPGTGYSALGAIAVERARQRGIGRELPGEWFVQKESS
jgi:ornithine cyclodeaminase/alanine dehydrogenase-like protein (mu-crystallin family)